MQINTNNIFKQIIINKYRFKFLFIVSIKKFTLCLIRLLWNIQYILGYTILNSLSICIYLQKIQYKLKTLFINLKSKFKNNIKFKKLYAVNTIQPNAFILFSNKTGLTVYNLTKKEGGILLI